MLMQGPLSNSNRNSGYSPQQLHWFKEGYFFSVYCPALSKTMTKVFEMISVRSVSFWKAAGSSRSLHQMMPFLPESAFPNLYNGADGYNVVMIELEKGWPDRPGWEITPQSWNVCANKCKGERTSKIKAFVRFTSLFMRRRNTTLIKTLQITGKS